VADVFNNQRVIEAEARELQARAPATPRRRRVIALTSPLARFADASRAVRQADGALDFHGQRLRQSVEGTRSSLKRR
jgi:hypothetical protein